MKYSEVTLGQIEAIINKIGGMEGMRQLLAGEMEAVPIKKSKLLVADGHFSACELVANHDPKKFFQTRKGLYVWSGFVDWIVAAANPTEVGKKFGKVARFQLVKNVTGKRLKVERPKDIWTATDFCAWLSVKLKNQSNGEDGELNTDCWNLFLVEGVNREVFVVYVCWYSAIRKWFVVTWSLVSEWNAGSRFASKPI